MLESIKKTLNEVLIETQSDFDIISCSDGLDIIAYLITDLNSNNIKFVITDENMEYINWSYAIRFIRNLEEKKKLNTLI